MPEMNQLETEASSSQVISARGFQRPLTRMQFLVRNVLPVVVNISLAVALASIGVALDTHIKVHVVVRFLMCLFVVELPLRCCYGDRQSHCFVTCLVIDTLLTSPIIVATFAMLWSRHANASVFKLLRLFRLLLLLRAKDLLIAMHRRAMRSPGLCYTLLLAMLSTCMLVYLMALVLRVRSKVKDDDQFPTVGTAMMYLAPFALPLLVAYAYLSWRSSRSLARAMQSNDPNVDLLRAQALSGPQAA